MLLLARSAHLAIVGHLLDGLPDEACGLLAGPGRPPGIESGGSVPTAEVGEAVRFYPDGQRGRVEPGLHRRAA